MRRSMLLVAFAVSLIVSGSAQERDRAKISDKWKWNLIDLYPSDEAWMQAKEKFKAEYPKLGEFKGTLGSSGSQLLKCLDFGFSLYKEYNRLYLYTSLQSDQDTRDPKYLGLVQDMGQLGADLGAKGSFIEPEILAIDQAKVAAWLSQEKGLGVYKFYIDDILRRKPHTGTEAEEKIIADAALVSDAASNTYGIFTDADFPYPTATLSNGQSVKLDKAAYELYRAGSNRDDRRIVFKAFFEKLNEFRTTFGTMMYGEVKKNMFFAKAQKYNSALERSVNGANIPVQVYKSLVENANSNVNTLHRYLSLRKRLLAVDTLHYYDLYAPLLKSVDLTYQPEEATKLVLASLSPLGKGYVDVVNKALNERWLDWYPTTGKRSGAYSNGGAYDVHPYMLLNYNGKYNDVRTLTHELGHTMQSYLSNKAQPYPTAGYPTFTAEVASTFNEALLNDYMLKTVKDDNVRLSLLGSVLEGLKGTFFRQTQFAEFEMRIHELAEKGESLTGDKLNELYLEITRKYYGHAKGVCVVDDEIKAEWMFIPHFYYNFYVYQYATSFTASAALSEPVLAGNKDATKRYMEFISSGGSDYAINLLKKAGVDMTTSQPFEITMRKMNKVMDEMDKLLDKLKR
ncbi:MAG: oligoendopeptidase F [Ignavibacteriae bacterium]|nr:oligoendopeptidase F [Ignavibacteriota bacterium]